MCQPAAELRQPGIHLLKWPGFQPVETALRVHRGFHKTGVAQHAQVLGYGRLRHTKLTLDLPHRLFGRDQESQYRAAVRFRNDFEHRFHALCILYRAYTCQGIHKAGANKNSNNLGASCMWSILWSGLHIWKSFKSCWIKSFYTPPTRPRSGPSETGLLWCAMPCGNISGGWNCEPVKSATARVTRDIRKPTRRSGVGKRRPLGHKNSSR